jgi:hypothetical protein
MTEDFHLMYEEISNSFHKVDEFRAKLLGFLPLASGTLMSVLLRDGSVVSYTSTCVLCVFGALITMGLYFYELRGVQRCNILVRLGASLEDNLGFRGPFTAKNTTPRIVGVIGATGAAFVIYPTVFAAWVFVALLPRGLGAAVVGAAGGCLGLFVLSVSLAVSGQLDPTRPKPVKHQPRRDDDGLRT